MTWNYSQLHEIALNNINEIKWHKSNYNILHFILRFVELSHIKANLEWIQLDVDCCCVSTEVNSNEVQWIGGSEMMENDCHGNRSGIAAAAAGAGDAVGGRSRRCLKKCRMDEDCKGRGRRCLCDGLCGWSCIKTSQSNRVNQSENQSVILRQRQSVKNIAIGRKTGSYETVSITDLISRKHWRRSKPPK